MLRRILAGPVVAFAFAVDRLRRLPGADLAGRLAPAAIAVLLVAAVVAVVAWGSETSPQRVSLAQLAAGQLSRMQTWIIVSGELQAIDSPTAGVRLYRLTDPAAPNAHLVVRSSRQLLEGWTTVSGHVEGGREPVPAGYEWAARLLADEELATEQPPPWLAGGFVLAAAVIAVARRSRYPVFVAEGPAPTGERRGEIRVGVRRESASADEPATHARLDCGRWPGDDVWLRVGSEEPVPLRLHSAHTSAEVGELRWLGRSEPVLRVRASAEDLILVFDSNSERDAAAAALEAEVTGRTTTPRD